MYLVNFFFIILPIMDEFLEYDYRNPTKEEEKKLEKDLRFKLPLYICVFCDWFLTLFIVQMLISN